jgi:hypothetical protein
VLPVCVGVAVLKYRLYEIDRIISRVISYAIVTAMLAGVFAGLVLLATVALPFKTPVAVAAATLAAAALFNPLRRRVQDAVDRRFNRARYNAEVIVAAFTARLRQTVDLETVRGDLVGVVHEAFQPDHVSGWLAGTRQQAQSCPACGTLTYAGRGQVTGRRCPSSPIASGGASSEVPGMRLPNCLCVPEVEAFGELACGVMPDCLDVEVHPCRPGEVPHAAGDPVRVANTAIAAAPRLRCSRGAAATNGFGGITARRRGWPAG